MPAKPEQLTRFNNFKFFCEIPPRAIIFFLVKRENNLNFLIPKKFLFFLKREDKKIVSTPCNSLVLISLILCAEPKIIKSFL